MRVFISSEQFRASAFSLRCKADLSIPTNEDVLEIFWLNLAICAIKYFLSKISLASLNGNASISSFISVLLESLSS
jgi:hypothetical protein